MYTLEFKSLVHPYGEFVDLRAAQDALKELGFEVHDPGYGAEEGVMPSPNAEWAIVINGVSQLSVRIVKIIVPNPIGALNKLLQERMGTPVSHTLVLASRN